MVQQDSLSGQWVDATESNWQSSNVFAQVPDGRYKVKLRTRIDNQNDLFQPHHISEVCATSSEFDVACTQFTCDYYIKAVDANGQEVSKLTLTQGTTTCEAYINLSGTPCSPIASAPCGSVPTINIVGGSTEAGPYLTGLAVGDEFTAADYTVTVTSLYSAGGDTYSGEGYVTVKLVGGTSVDITVEFADIKINDCYQLVVGTVKSMYDPSWSNVADVDELLELVTEDVTGLFEDINSLFQEGQPLDSLKAQDVRQRLGVFHSTIAGSAFMADQDTAAFNQSAQCALISLEEAIEQVGASSAPNARSATAMVAAEQAKVCYEEMVIQFFNAIKSYLTRCQAENWASYDSKGIVPKCLWLNTPSIPYVLDPAFTAGFVDGAYAALKDAGETVYTIADLYGCVSLVNNAGGLRYLYDPTFSTNCKKKFTQLLEPIGVIKDLVLNTSLSDAWKGVKKAASTFVDQTVCFNDTCRYNQGKIVFEVASAFIPIGGIMRSGLKAAKMTEVLRKVDEVSDQIKNINRAINGVKGKIVKGTVTGIAGVKIGAKTLGEITTGVIKIAPNMWKANQSGRWIVAKTLYGVDYFNAVGKKVTKGVMRLWKRTDCRIASGAADDGCDWLVEGVSGKAIRLANFPNIAVWVNSLDDALDAKLLAKIDELNDDFLSKLNADIVHPKYGATIKELVEENADDLTEIWKRMKEDVGFCWEMRREGGSRWQKWAQRAVFKDATQKGKAFENLVLNSIKARSGAWYNKLKQEVATFGVNNLDEYEFFEQVQFGFPQHKLREGSFVDYFIADQVFVKFKTVDGILQIDDMVILETKLSRGTDLTPNQGIAKGLNSYTVRGNRIPGIPSGSKAQFNNSIKWVKAYDAGVGNVITDITTNF